MSIDLHATGAESAEIPADRLFHLSEDRFRRIEAAGIFGPGEPVALVDGLVRDGGPAGPPITSDSTSIIGWTGRASSSGPIASNSWGDGSSPGLA